MASQYDFFKNGEVASVLGVHDNFDIMLTNISINILNIAEDGIETYSPYQANYDLLNSEAKKDGASTAELFTAFDNIQPAPEVYDLFETGTVDTSLWTVVGTVTEAGGQLTIGANGSLSSATTKSTGGGEILDGAYIKFYGDRTGSFATWIHNIIITDGSTPVTIKTWSNSTGANELYEIYISEDGETAYFYIDGTLHDTVDISSVTGTKLLKIEMDNDGTVDVNGRWVLDYIYINQSTSSFWESTALDSVSGTILSAFIWIDTISEPTSGGTVTIELTADGTNWEEVENGEVHEFTNTGSSLQAKFTLTSTVDGTKPATVNQYVVQYWT